MFRLKKSTKYIIVALMVAVSAYFAARFSGLLNIFNLKTSHVEVDDQRAEEFFENARNDKKIKLLYFTTNLNSFNHDLQVIYNKYGLIPKYAKNTSNYNVSIFDFPDSLSDLVMSDLRNLDNLNQEFLDTSDPDEYKINIQEHITNKERVKRTLENKIDNAVLLTEDRISKYNDNLTRIQLEIDSLRNQQKIIKTLADNKLVYITSLFRDASQSANLRIRRINIIRNFLIYFLAVLVITILILVIANYFIAFVFRIMRMLGIKTARSSSGGYSYGSGYSYKSRYYYRRPKKVKKIYKDADGNIIKQKVSKE